MSARFPSNASCLLFLNRAFPALISLTFKSLKPSASFALSVQPADSISSIKEQLLVAHPNAPPPDAQRLLFKGKALSDSKLLQEYSVKDGDVINLMLKPGTNWDPSKPTEPTPTSQMAAPTPVNPLASVGGSLEPQATRTSRHQRIPSVVLSPSPSNDGTLPEQKDIVLTVDAGLISSPSSTPEKTSTYQTILAKPDFWQNLHQFLRYVVSAFHRAMHLLKYRTEFTNEADVHVAFEDFLAAAKGNLTASEIAKIRDHVGIVGMAGT